MVVTRKGSKFDLVWNHSKWEGWVLSICDVRRMRFDPKCTLLVLNRELRGAMRE